VAEPVHVGHTDEARALVLTGDARPGDKSLDVPIDSMTDREILSEILTHSRNTRDAVTQLIEGILSSPFGSMISGGKVSGPLAFLFGQQE
jgi:hypothetical protein